MTRSSSSSNVINVGDLITWREIIDAKDVDEFAIVFAMGTCDHRGYYGAASDKCLTIMWEEGTIGHFDIDDDNMFRVIR